MDLTKGDNWAMEKRVSLANPSERWLTTNTKVGMTQLQGRLVTKGGGNLGISGKRAWHESQG